MRSIPVTLQDHLEQSAQTLCLLLKIVCRDGDVFGFTSNDRARTYDDGVHLLEYQQRAGFEMSAVEATSELGVDNAEASQLIPVFDLPDDITELQINGGKLDYAEFWVWGVNYEDLDTSDSPYVAKHWEVMSGTLGQARMTDGQLVFNELRSLSQQMQQSIVPLTSLTCRTELGSPICGVDVTPLWRDFTVTDVGFESDRTFTIVGPEADSPAIEDWRYTPGLVEWYTGDNAGMRPQVESVAVGVVTLSTATRYPVQNGDTGRIRPDCRKRYLEDCIGVYANGLEFDGEPHLPIGDEDTLSSGEL